jgi:hypothetical protein
MDIKTPVIKKPAPAGIKSPFCGDGDERLRGLIA